MTSQGTQYSEALIFQIKQNLAKNYIKIHKIISTIGIVLGLLFFAFSIWNFFSMKVIFYGNLIPDFFFALFVYSILFIPGFFIKPKPKNHPQGLISENELYIKILEERDTTLKIWSLFGGILAILLIAFLVIRILFDPSTNSSGHSFEFYMLFLTFDVSYLFYKTYDRSAKQILQDYKLEYSKLKEEQTDKK